MQAFVVTSAGVAEGKTLTALNLAWLLAQTDGVRALIIDSDLRQPCAAEYLGIDAPVGLSEVLSGEATLQETIIRLEPAGLHLLPGGEPRDDVAEVLSGPRFGHILAELRRMFDYIIIDAPPLGIFTDASLLINRADGALLVVRSGKTRYSVLDRLIAQLPRERMLGVKIGSVVSETLDPKTFLATVRMSIDPAYKLPEDTVAEIVSNGLLGEQYLSLVPGGEDKTIPPQKARVEMTKGEEVTVAG